MNPVNRRLLLIGPQFVAGIVNRTHVAQDQEQVLLAAKLVLKAQKNARRLQFAPPASGTAITRS